MAYAILIRVSEEGFESVQKSPKWIDDDLIESLVEPKDVGGDSYYFKFFEDRKHLIDSGYAG